MMSLRGGTTFIWLEAVRDISNYFWISWCYVDEKNFRFRRPHVSCVQWAKKNGDTLYQTIEGGGFKQ